MPAASSATAADIGLASITIRSTPSNGSEGGYALVDLMARYQINDSHRARIDEAADLVDLMARYQINDQLSAQLNVENLFNKKYRDQYGWGQYGYGSPRYISAGFRYEF